MAVTGTKAVEREIKINASPETVFAFLVEPAKLRRWMTIGGTTDIREGADFRYDLTKEDVAVGRYVEIKRPSRVVMTWGWEGEDAVTKPGSSTLEISLTPDGAGTLVRLQHRDLPTEESATSHGHGWQHYLERLSVAATGGDPGPDSFQE
ncbi:MAG: SRPBCC domain-containing protein [Candidatus Eremiobacteraeota bacterium]|nr:SRPBCC domain-containing protein [Candidatus Eremiobacteraeota bacterium]